MLNLLTLSQNGEADPAADRRLLWFGLLGGGIAWLVHLLAAYAIAEFGCVANFPRFTFLGITGIAWLLIAVTAFTTLMAVLAAGLAYRAEQQIRAQLQVQQQDAQREDVSKEHEPTLYVANAGWISSLLFTLIILVESVPVFYFLSGC